MKYSATCNKVLQYFERSTAFEMDFVGVKKGGD